jgi:hypothetical protein
MAEGRHNSVINTYRGRTMSDDSFGETILPLHCRVSASADKTKLALTFQSKDRAPFTIVLPVLGAAGLQRNIAQTLYILAKSAPAPAVEELVANAAD